LGVVLASEFEETRLDLKPGEAITFLTDGVVEAANAKGDLFGFDRTREISTLSAQEIAEAAKAWGQNDDITVVKVRRSSR
jgi:serine phosphatase RsbU (regulator of sigma subunit)